MDFSYIEDKFKGQKTKVGIIGATPIETGYKDAEHEP